MDNPLLVPEHQKSELQKFKIFYEHVADKRDDTSAVITKQRTRK